MFLFQIITIFFLLFALSRVFLRAKGGQIKTGESFFWGVVFTAAGLAIVFPRELTSLANSLGVGRGADLVVYISIIALFYLVFRIYVMMENIRHEITELVRKVALEKKTK
ncbi:MAG: DUF2304 family protein [Patescibacteria group bacterium]|nr:DUF2304 family protein [Patescibacteria group bacterium]MCL5431571.1 DUF2304 family protein [Patescibacteria group bacterium]